MPTSPSTPDHQSDVPPAVQARIDAGFACARCGREDGPMHPADDSNTRFVHTDACPGAVAPDDGPAAAFTMHPKGRPGPAGSSATRPQGLAHLSRRVDAADERIERIEQLAEQAAGVGAAAVVDGPGTDQLSAPDGPRRRLGRAAAAADSRGEAEVSVPTADLLALLDASSGALPTFGESARALIAAADAEDLHLEDQLWQVRQAMTRVLQWRDLGYRVMEGSPDAPEDLLAAHSGLLDALEVHLRDDGGGDFAGRIAGIWGAADRLEQALAGILLGDGR